MRISYNVSSYKYISSTRALVPYTSRGVGGSPSSYFSLMYLFMNYRVMSELKIIDGTQSYRVGPRLNNYIRASSSNDVKICKSVYRRIYYRTKLQNWLVDCEICALTVERWANSESGHIWCQYDRSLNINDAYERRRIQWTLWKGYHHIHAYFHDLVRF